ncbi:MAG: hypothetical protein U0797_24015 [Gemmataceae bacterium]
MALRRPRRLRLQRLEDRSTPAVTTRLVGGLLSIRSDNLGNTLVIAETATPGQFTVTNQTGLGPVKTVGTFKFSNLSITMGNGNDTVDLQVKTALTGNLSVSLGNGTDVFTTQTSTLGSRVGGDAVINLGLGGQRPGDTYDQEVQWQNVNLGGSLTAVGTPGSGAELLNIEAARVGKSVSATNFFQTSLGLVGDSSRASTVGGNVSVNNVQKNTDSRDDTPPAVGGNGLNLYDLSTVNGNIGYVGGAGIDRVQLPQDVNDAAAPVFINGNVTVNGGGGDNLFAMGTGKPGSGAAAHVRGSVSYTGGAGVDRVFLDTGSTVGGNALFSLGEGDNEIFNGAVEDGTVGGSLTIRAGNGDNFLGDYSALLRVGGNLTVQFGNGDNFSTSFFNTFLEVGGTATYRAGTGSNSLDITNQTIGNLVLIFQGGPTTVSFNQPSGVFNGNVYLDYGVGLGPKVLGGTATLTGTVVLLNYP